MSNTDDLQSASRIAAANGAMSYKEWRQLNATPIPAMAIGGAVGAIGGALAGAIVSPLMAIGAGVAAGIFGAASVAAYDAMTNSSAKRETDYINYVKKSDDALQKMIQQELAQSNAKETQTQIEVNGSKNVDKLLAQNQFDQAKGVSR